MNDRQAAVDELMSDLWFNLLKGPRRALCEIAYMDPAIGDRMHWQALTVDQRMQLVRAMRSMVDICIDCSTTLEAVRAKLEASRASH